MSDAAAELSPQEAKRRPRRPDANNAAAPGKVAWRVLEWSAAVGLGSTKTHELIRDKRVDSVMLDGRRLITTPPKTFIDGLR